MADYVIATGAVSFAAKEVLGAERSAVTRAYASVIALCLRDANHSGRGYAARLIDVLSEQIAAQRVGAKWEALNAADRISATRAAFPTAKRYAEKSVGIAKKAAEKHAPVTEIANADTDEDAAKLVKAWLLSLGCTTQEALFDTFGFAKNAGKREAKADPTAPSPAVALDANGDAIQTEAAPVAAPATAPAAEADKPADNRSVADVSRENALKFAESVRAVMAGMSDADRKAFADVIFADVQAAVSITVESAELVAA